MAENYQKEITKRLTTSLLDIQLLRLINTESMWGYKIKKTIETQTDLKLRHGDLYTTLNQLEQNEYLTSQTQKQNGRPRKTYTITPKGKQYLQTYYNIIQQQLNTQTKQ